ncbi:Serine carboxypeptidase-like 45 [Trifolium repens]|jgi:serine carboxypeptidase-like clade 2|nr:Serine carboxypeptidase-like 45 [Trifolium repens]
MTDFFFLFFICLEGSEADKVIRLPDQPQVDFQQYASYITVDVVNQRNLFYYFVEFEVDPVSKPVVLWLSGDTV